ncbi:MAG: hypothetical protein ACRD0P_00375 [Stackebrandtia sp.]
MTTSAPQSPVTSTVPAPPRGPGADVPFAAPPRDPDKSRLVIGIVVGITAFVLVCGGAVGAAVGVLVWSSNELAAQSQQAADEFLEHIVDEDYPKAYKSLCEPARDDVTQQEFTEFWEPLGAKSAETVGIRSGEQDLVVSAEVTRDDGVEQEIDLTVVLGPQSMTMQVCDWKIVQ